MKVGVDVQEIAEVALLVEMESVAVQVIAEAARQVEGDCRPATICSILTNIKSNATGYSH